MSTNEIFAAVFIGAMLIVVIVLLGKIYQDSTRTLPVVEFDPKVYIYAVKVDDGWRWDVYQQGNMQLILQPPFKSWMDAAYFANAYARRYDND